MNMEKTHMIELQSYYMDIGGDGDREVTDRFLSVNCAGCHVGDKPFTTDNRFGRSDFYLQYMMDGEFEISGGRRMRCGDAIVYHPHTAYYYMAKMTKTRYLWVHFSGSAAAEIVRECGFLNAEVVRPGMDEGIVAGFEGLFRDFVRRGQLFELSLAQNLLKILYDISLASRREKPESKTEELMARVLREMHRGYSGELTIRGLAESVYVSEGYLRALFKERFGVSPKRYLTSVRVSAAKQLLVQTDMTVERVSREVGMPDALYFSRVFRDVTGVSPTEYRRRFYEE